jgi:uncharacterized protein (TIGR02145 family)
MLHYKEIQIGEQIWMLENLNVETFQNGDIIFEAKSSSDWKKANKNKTPAWCYYDNDPMHGRIYGKLYNWFAIIDSRGLAPKGWQIPSGDEWSALIKFLSEKERTLSFAYDGTGIKMKNLNGWENGGDGNNESKFSGLPGGHRNTEGEFDLLGYYGLWWSSESFLNMAYYLGLSYDSDDAIYGELHYKENGYSVRCLKE